MEFCVITPIAGLEKYGSLTRRHLLLPQVQDPKYVDFYLARKEAGDFLILDNGAYEGKADWALLEKMIEVYKPQVCALPDYLLQYWGKTYHASMHYLDLWYEKYPKVDWMFIPQTVKGDVMSLLEGLHQVLEKEHQRVKWIGLSRAIVTKISTDPLLRANICKWIKQRSHCKVHALGMASGSVVEMQLLAEARCDSIDSSSPVWRGWNGYAQLSENWPDIQVNFQAELPSAKALHTLIAQNLEECGVRTNRIR